VQISFCVVIFAFFGVFEKLCSKNVVFCVVIGGEIVVKVWWK